MNNTSKHSPLERPRSLKGETYKIKLDHLKNSIYLTINDIQVDGAYRPLEVFVNTMNPMMVEPMGTLTRLLSAILRQGGNIEFAFKELEDMFSSEPFWYKGKQYYSVVSIIGELLITHCKKIGYKDENK